MSDETIVAEIRDIMARLNIKAAAWEWAIWKETSVPRLHFLKITLLPSEPHQTSEVILDVASLSLSRSVTPLSEVNRLLDHCLAVRPLLAQIHVAPPDGIEFRIGPHNVQVIGNFPTSKVDFYGSVAAKNHWPLRADTPFYLAEYALHSSVTVEIQRTFYETDPPFSNIGELYNHHFGVDNGQRTGSWCGILLPVHIGQIDSLAVSPAAVTIRMRFTESLIEELSLGVVCRGEGAAAFRKRFLVRQEQLEFKVDFSPASLEVALYYKDLLIDFVQWQPLRPALARAALVAETVLGENDAESVNRLVRVRHHYRLLKAQLETYDQANGEKWGIVRGNLYRIFKDTVFAAQDELPGLLPAFADEQFLEGNDHPGNVYNATAIRTYLRMALAALEGDVELATGIERRHMELAIEEARKCTSEDARARPKVGVVVVKDGVVLASAYRGQLGEGEHAEFTALEKVLRETSIAGATVYTTLEPCTTRNHPKVPCAKRLIERKVARVVIGMLDPDPRISGRGVAALRDANIGVDLFPDDLKSQIEEANRDFRRDIDSRATTAETQLKVQEAELGQTRQRLVEVVQQLPPPELTADQRSRLERSLRELGSGTVSIQYVDTPTARADPFAWRLTEVFRAAGWHVEIRGEQWGHLNYKKLMMRIEDITSIRPNQKAVLEALQRASISCGLLPGHNVSDRVELIVGEM